MKKYIFLLFLILSIGLPVNANTLESEPTEPATESAQTEPVATDPEDTSILEEVEINADSLTDPVDPTDPNTDTQLLQAIEDRLENLEGIQKDQFNLLLNLGYLALGTLIGMVAFHLFFREVLKW